MEVLIRHPMLSALCAASELDRLSLAQILLLWTNYQLRQSGSRREVANFAADFRDPTILLRLCEATLPSEMLARPDVGSDASASMRTLVRQVQKLGLGIEFGPKEAESGNERYSTTTLWKRTHTHTHT